MVLLALDTGETAQVLKTFMQSNIYDFTVLLNGSSAALNYGVSGIPMTFFISRTGTIQYVKLDQPLSHFPWAISDGGVISQSRFESEAAAQIAYRNHLLSRKGD